MGVSDEKCIITKITKNQCLCDLPGTLSRVLVGLHFLEFKLELNPEKEGFMVHTAREDAQRPMAVYAINPSFSVFN